MVCEIDFYCDFFMMPLADSPVSTLQFGKNSRPLTKSESVKIYDLNSRNGLYKRNHPYEKKSDAQLLNDQTNSSSSKKQSNKKITNKEDNACRGLYSGLIIQKTELDDVEKIQKKIIDRVKKALLNSKLESEIKSNKYLND